MMILVQIYISTYDHIYIYIKILHVFRSIYVYTYIYIYKYISILLPRAADRSSLVGFGLLVLLLGGIRIAGAVHVLRRLVA